MTISREHEREIKCSACRAVLIVGGFVDDLDPETYVGVSCGCRQPVWDGAPSSAVEALGRARTAQEAVRG